MPGADIVQCADERQSFQFIFVQKRYAFGQVLHVPERPGAATALPVRSFRPRA